MAVLAPEAIDALAALAVRVQLARRAAPGAWTPLPHQVPPPPDGEWDAWLLLAGRGAGKTAACAAYVDAAARRAPLRIGIIAPTLGDAVDACVLGPSGLKALDPAVRLRAAPGGLVVDWPNGSRARLFGASSPDDVERLRAGGNRHLDWYEELAAWRHGAAALEQARFGLRLGARPRAVASTTPKAKRHLLDFMARAGTAIARATTDDNPHLDAGVRATLYAAYGGTRLGRQELQGELLRDVEGALWTRARLEACAVRAAPPLARVVVGVDPAVSSGPDSDLTGIVACGKGEDGRGYVLYSAGVRMGPDGWARKVVGLYHDLDADAVVAEANQGGDLVRAVLRTVDPHLPLRLVHASRGKRTRAEPVAALWEQGRASIVAGDHALLEDQLCTYTGEPGEASPDVLDALVWAMTELFLRGREVRLL